MYLLKNMYFYQQEMKPRGIIVNLVNHTPKVVRNLPKMQLDKLFMVYLASLYLKRSVPRTNKT